MSISHWELNNDKVVTSWTTVFRKKKKRSACDPEVNKNTSTESKGDSKSRGVPREHPRVCLIVPRADRVSGEAY